MLDGEQIRELSKDELQTVRSAAHVRRVFNRRDTLGELVEQTGDLHPARAQQLGIHYAGLLAEQIELNAVVTERTGKPYAKNDYLVTQRAIQDATERGHLSRIQGLLRQDADSFDENPNGTGIASQLRRLADAMPHHAVVAVEFPQPTQIPGSSFKIRRARRV